MSAKDPVCLRCSVPVRLHDDDMKADCFDALYFPAPKFSKTRLFMVMLLAGLFLVFLLM